MNWPKPLKRTLTVLINLNLLLLLIIAGALYFNKPIAHSKMARETNKYIVSEIPKETLKENQNVDANFNWEDVTPLTAEKIINQPPPQNLPVVAGIAIPELGINMPIFKGVDDLNLYYGAGTTSENQIMGEGNYGLASHHVFGIWGATNLLFSPLEYAQEGQSIYLTDKDYVYTYKVSSVLRVAPDQSDVLDPPSENDDPLVTLVTCTDVHATARIIVQGKLVKKQLYDDAPQDVKNAFQQQYNIWQQ